MVPPYGTIVALSESPLDANLIAIGTDDGLIQITDDGGDNWKKIDNISGAPKRSYVNSVYLSKHDVNVIYVAFNHHKYGDFKPYIFMSKDKGKSWESISNNLPERGSVYSLEEDHEKEGLIFCGTEFGAFFSPDFIAASSAPTKFGKNKDIMQANIAALIGLLYIDSP